MIIGKDSKKLMSTIRLKLKLWLQNRSEIPQLITQKINDKDISEKRSKNFWNH